MTEEEFEDFYSSGKWENHKLKWKTIIKVKRCSHDMYNVMDVSDKTGYSYCKKCNHRKWVDRRTKEDIKIKRDNMNKRIEKEAVQEAEINYKYLLTEYVSKYGEDPLG